MTLSSPNRGYPLTKLDGNTGSMGYWVGVFDRTATKLRSLQTAADDATDVDGVAWSVRMTRAKASSLKSKLSAPISEAELLSSVLSTYSDAFDTSAKLANDLIDDVQDAHDEWTRLSAEASRAGNAALAASRVADVSEQSAEDSTEASADAREAIAERDTAKATLDALWEQFEGYYTAWDEAYDTALAALAGATSGLSPAEEDFLNALLSADTPEEVAALWAAHPNEWEALKNEHPDIIGNLDGIPWDVRAEVNREHLENMLATEPEGPRRQELKAIQAAIEAGGVPAPNLISFDPDGSEQVTAAIAYGDLSTATEINTLIPGMNATVADMAAWGGSAQRLNESVGPGSATVVWFGYDTPDLTEEPGMSRAEDGAAALAGYIKGLNALNSNADINVIGHSYGSTTAAQAIGSDPNGLGVDAFITVGSAGFPNDQAIHDNLASGRTPIYSTISEDDEIARIGRGTSTSHPVSPERMDGVTVFGSDGGMGVDSCLPASTSHDALGPGAYLEPGSESFYNIGTIIVDGEPGTEIDGVGSQRGFWDPSNWWIKDEYAFIAL